MNPYEILGVSENATDTEVKNAYRELAKKYHPDNYQDSPLADVAEKKMQEINEAYDKICDMRRDGDSSSNTSNSYTYGKAPNANSNKYTRTNFPDVRKLIKEGRIDDAMQILNGVSAHARSAEWYFLMGMCFSRKGWTDQAYSYFQSACRMEPSNQEFMAALNNMNAHRAYRHPGYNTAPTTGGCTVCDICAGIMCVDCCCDCMGGPGCC